MVSEISFLHFFTYNHQLLPILFITGEGMRFKEIYSSGKVGTFNIPFPSEVFTTLSRELIVTYLDDDLMIVRDNFGCPDVLKKTAKLPLIAEPGSINSEPESEPES